MQLRVLLHKDLTALFKQKSVIFTLVFPMFVIIFIGLIPMIVQNSDAFEVGYLIEDEGIDITNGSLNLGDQILDSLKELFNSDETLKLVLMKDFNQFISFENALYIPKNFTYIANLTRVATYYITMSDSNLRARPVMTGSISQIVDNVVTNNLLPIDPPITVGKQVFTESELLENGVAKNRGSIAFPLAYIAFLILIMGASSMRLTGFSAEREADMMELLLSSVIFRRELILSKLIIGVVYGFASVISYLIGIAIVLIANFSFSNGDKQVILFDIPRELINTINILAIVFLFITLSFISMEFLLAFQLLMGKEGGEKFGSTGLMILTIMFYATSITDPLAESPIQIINPFFWAFKITLNIIFRENLVKTILYLIAILLLSGGLLTIQTNSIEKEKVLFE